MSALSRFVAATAAVFAWLATLSPPPADAQPLGYTWSAEPPEHEVLFAGEFDEIWEPYAMRYNGGTTDMAATVDGVLTVEIPVCASGSRDASHVGLVSMNQPALWLSGLAEGGEITLTYRFIPERTNGFNIMLQVGTTYSANAAPPGPRLVFSRRQLAPNSDQASADKTPDADVGAPAGFYLYTTATTWPDTVGDPVPAPETAPQLVTLHITEGEVTVEGDNFEPLSTEWPWLTDGQALYMHVFSHGPAASDVPSRMALSQIELARSSPEAPHNSTPQLEPLMAETLFPVDDRETHWETIGVAGGNFEAFGRFEEDGTLVVEAPEGNWWSKTGLLSLEPIFVPDERIYRAPQRLSLKLDPTRTTGFAMPLSTRCIDDMWLDKTIWPYFIYDHETDEYVLGVNNGLAADFNHRVPADWIENEWNGWFHLDITHNWFRVSLDGGPTIRGTFSTFPGHNMYANIVSHPARRGEATSLTLERVERRYLLLPSASEADRFFLMDNAEFDAEEFVRYVGREMEGVE